MLSRYATTRLYVMSSVPCPAETTQMPETRACASSWPTPLGLTTLSANLYFPPPFLFIRIRSSRCPEHQRQYPCRIQLDMKACVVIRRAAATASAVTAFPFLLIRFSNPWRRKEDINTVSPRVEKVRRGGELVSCGVLPPPPLDGTNKDREI